VLTYRIASIAIDAIGHGPLEDHCRIPSHVLDGEKGNPVPIGEQVSSTSVATGGEGYLNRLI